MSIREGFEGMVVGFISLALGSLMYAHTAPDPFTPIHLAAVGIGLVVMVGSPLYYWSLAAHRRLTA